MRCPWTCGPRDPTTPHPGVAPQRPDPPHVYQHTPSSLLVAFTLPRANGKPINRIEVERLELLAPHDTRLGEGAYVCALLQCCSSRQ